MHPSHALSDVFSVSSPTILVLEEEAQCGSQHTVCFQETSAEILLLMPPFPLTSFTLIQNLVRGLSGGKKFLPFLFLRKMALHFGNVTLKIFL